MSSSGCEVANSMAVFWSIWLAALMRMAGSQTSNDPRLPHEALAPVRPVRLDCTPGRRFRGDTLVSAVSVALGWFWLFATLSEVIPRLFPDTWKGGGGVAGQRVGYRRVSTGGQSPQRQLDGVEVDRTYWTGEAGDAAGEVHLLEGLLPDQERVLGTDHPDTLTTRNNIANLRGEGRAAGWSAVGGRDQRQSGREAASCRATARRPGGDNVVAR